MGSFINEYYTSDDESSVDKLITINNIIGDFNHDELTDFSEYLLDTFFDCDLEDFEVDITNVRHLLMILDDADYDEILEFLNGDHEYLDTDHFTDDGEIEFDDDILPIDLEKDDVYELQDPVTGETFYQINGVFYVYDHDLDYFVPVENEAINPYSIIKNRNLKKRKIAASHGGKWNLRKKFLRSSQHRQDKRRNRIKNRQYYRRNKMKIKRYHQNYNRLTKKGLHRKKIWLGQKR